MSDRPSKFAYPRRQWRCWHDGATVRHPMPGQEPYEHDCCQDETHCPASPGFILPPLEGHARGDDYRCVECGDFWICGTVWAHIDHAFDDLASYSGVGRCKCGFATAHYALAIDIDPEFDEHLSEAEARGETVIW